MGAHLQRTVESDDLATGEGTVHARLRDRGKGGPPQPIERSEARPGVTARKRRTASPEDPIAIAANDLNFHIPENWSLMAVFVAAAFVFVGLVNLVVPPLTAIVTAVVSVGLCAAGGVLAKYERRKSLVTGIRIGLLLLAVIFPMFLVGWALAQWIIAGSLSWEWGIATVIVLNTVATTLLSRRLAGLFGTTYVSWSALVVAEGSVAAYGALAAGIVVGGFVARYQWKLERARMEIEQSQDRVRRRAEDILREYEDTGLGWFWETDRRGRLTYVSESAADALDRSPQSLRGRPFIELFDLGERREGERTLTFHLSARSAFQELPVRAAATGEKRFWSISGRPVYDSFGNFVGFRGSGTDLTEKKRSQEQASRLAHYDSLTGLANRHQMSQLLEKVLAAPQETQRECSVFLLDLDRFKHVNDTLGHPAGDALLKQVAQRLERSVGAKGRVGRLGGDEFEVIVPGRIEAENLAALAQEIISSLSQPYSIEGQRVVIGASIGIARSPQDGESSEALIRNSDLALYAAKDGGRGRYHFYANDLHSAAEERSQLEQDLRDAISAGQLELHYQPVVHTATEQIAGFEALLRWQHPERGWLSPDKFIPIAEDAGLIEAIGEWALRTACHDLAKWPEHVRCAVNVSPLQFANANLPSIVTNAVARAGIAASRLELEITESVFLRDDEGTDAMFAALKNIGVRLALDDFGTGYSSLGYLKKAPFDKIKIDQSFVRGATEPGSRNGAIIASITSLAQALGMDTTAEGVETLDELDLVRLHGCSHIQGYIYEKPLTAASASERLATGLSAVATGPRSARCARQAMLRKVVLEHSGQYYNGTVRNISTTGALIEGLWNVPIGTIFTVVLSDSHNATATARWCDEDRMGVEFATPLERDPSGTISAVAAGNPAPVKRELRRTGAA